MALPQCGQRPSYRVLTAGALALLVVLAGCNVPILSGPQYPPGVNESGVQNGTALSNAHRAHLEQGFRVHETAVVVAENGTTLTTIESEMRWSETRANRSITHSRPHPLMGVRSEIYTNESTAFLRITGPDGDERTRRMDHTQRFLIPGPNAAWENIYAMVGTQNTTATVLENGTTRIRFQDAEMGSGSGTGTGTLYVTPKGFVTRYHISYESQWIGTPVRFERTVNFSHVGEPNVVKPDWVANVSTAG